MGHFLFVGFKIERRVEEPKRQIEQSVKRKRQAGTEINPTLW